MALGGGVIYLSAKACRVPYLSFGKCAITWLVTMLAVAAVNVVLALIPVRGSLVFTAVTMVAPLVMGWTCLSKCLGTSLLRGLAVYLVCVLFSILFALLVLLVVGLITGLKLLW
jgi:hypothetical protein